MVFSRLLASENVVGVDIGSSSIKLVYADCTMLGTRISHIAMCPTPPGSVKEGIVVDIPEVAAAIQFAMRSGGIKASSAIAAIAGPGVIVRHVQMPKVSEQILRKSIYFEVGKYISAPIEDSVVEFEILGDAEEEGQMNVMLVASPKIMIESRVAALEQAGLDPLAIDIEAFAVYRALLEYNSDASLLDKTVALLDIGASRSEINLVSKGNLALTRTIPIAGYSITNVIKNAENCSESEAEQRKFDLDLTEVVETSGNSTTNPSIKVLQSLIDELLREIRRSINFYQSQLPGGDTEMTIEKMIITGGTSRLKGLAPYTSRRLNIEVVIGNPDIHDLIDLASPGNAINEEDTALLTVAFGLSVKGMPAVARLSVAA